MNHILETMPGDSIERVAEKAKEIAKFENIIVEFNFNEIKVLVDKDTFIDNLVRTYMDSHIMEWKTIGPQYEWEYDTDTQIELYTRKLGRAKRRKKEQAEQAIKDKKEEDSVAALTTGIELLIIAGKEKEYADYVETNSKDGCSKGVVDYGEAWGKLMQVEIAKGRTVRDCAEETQKPLSYLGITGFMYGCAVKALAHFWLHGEELRKWHNKEYGVSEDKTGVVNPAVLTIG